MPSEFLNALKEGQILEEYQIVRVLGAGGFGITYLAFDKNLDKPVAIKEYLPNDLALRHGEAEVMPKATEASDDFKWGLEQFLREARTLAKFNHPNIIRINRFFEANGTGYIVMDYAEGQTLSDRIKQNGPLEESQLKDLLLAIADGLKQTHSFGILHRDIKPGNIMLLEDGTPILIDFGSARQAMGVKSKSVTSIVTPGYAPIEQYDTNGKQGPWTDIYALGAVAFVALVGERPPDATGRIRVDSMTPISQLKKQDASKAFLEAIDWALCPQEECRPQNVDSWVAALMGESRVGNNKADSGAQSAAIEMGDEKTVINKQSSNRPKTTAKPNKWSGSSVEVDTHNQDDQGNKTAYLIGAIVMVAVFIVATPYLSEFFNKSDSADNVDTNHDTVVADDQTSGVTVADTNIEDDPLTDEEAWQRAVEINTIESFLGYLTGFPTGNYVSQADTHLKALSAHDNISGQFYTASAVNVRKWPSTTSSTVASLSSGQQVRVNGKVVDRSWYSIDDAELGFVHSSLLQVSPLVDTSVLTQEQEREKIRQRWRDAIQQHNR